MVVDEPVVIETAMDRPTDPNDRLPPSLVTRDRLETYVLLALTLIVVSLFIGLVAPYILATYRVGDGL